MEYVQIDKRIDIKKGVIEDMRIALQNLCYDPKGNVRDILRLQKRIYTLLENQPDVFRYIVPENEGKRSNDPPN